MKCAVCGSEMRPVKSDLPFKTTEQTIVILKGLRCFSARTAPST